jgi:hypothetical protein
MISSLSALKIVQKEETPERRLTQIANQIIREVKRTDQPIDPHRARDELVRRTRESKSLPTRESRAAGAEITRSEPVAIVRGNGRSMSSQLINQIVTRPDPFRATTRQRQLAAQGIER